MVTQTNTTNIQQNKTISYNMLNLPQTVTANTGTTTTSTLTYTYDASGNKLRRQSTGLNNTTDYIAGIQYDGATIPAFNFIQTEEGKAVYQLSTGGFDYYYHLGDNLGNTRVMFDSQTTPIAALQSDDYFPFGMEIKGTIPSPKNEYLYNKKELQEELGEYDYGARFYDPVIARWTTIDPQAEQNRRFSPYNYCVNNPIRNIDPDGRQWVWNRITNEFRWEKDVYQQSELTDQENDRFVGINYLYTGDNGVRTLLSGDGNSYSSTLLQGNPLYTNFMFHRDTYEPMDSQDANGNPIGYIVPIPDMKPERLDSKAMWGVGAAADYGGVGAMILGKDPGVLGPIGIVAGGYPALINILNGVGNDDDLIAVGLSVGSVIALGSGYGLGAEIVNWGLGVGTAVNDYRTMPSFPPPTNVPLGHPSDGDEGDHFSDGSNNSPNYDDLGGDD
jgi:RHS repeat-associated protein